MKVKTLIGHLFKIAAFCWAVWSYIKIIYFPNKTIYLDRMEDLCKLTAYIIVPVAVISYFMILLILGKFDKILEKEIPLPEINMGESEKDKLLSEYGKACIDGDQQKQDKLFKILTDKKYIK